MSQPRQTQRPSVHKLLMAPFMTGMIFLLILTGISLYGQYVKYHQRELADRWDGAGKIYRQAFQGHQATMGTFLTAVAGDSRVQDALARGDAALLVDLYLPVFTSIKGQHEISQTRFIDVRHNVLARLHNLSFPHSVQVDRYGLALSARLGRSVAGLDIGADGRLLINMVQPVYSRGELAGFVEAGIDLTDTLKLIAEAQQTELVFLLKRDVLDAGRYNRLLTAGADRKAVAAGAAVRNDRPSAAGRSRDAEHSGPVWVSPGDGEMAYSFSGNLSFSLARALREGWRSASAGSAFSISNDGHDYATRAVDLFDSAGTPLGALMVLGDSAFMRRDYLWMAAGLLGAGLLIIFLCGRLAGRKLRQADALVNGMIDKMSEGDVLFQNVFEESETGFVLQNWVTGEVLMANRVAMRLFDAPQASAINISSLKPLPEEDELHVSWRASGSQSPLMVIRTETELTYCELSRFFMGANEEVECIAIRDVTRLLNLQHENRVQIEHLQAIIDQLPGMISIKDEGLRLTMYNTAFEIAFGEGANMIGKVFFADWLGPVIHEILETDALALEGDEQRSFDFSLRLRDGGERTYAITKQPITDPDGSRYLLSVATDITERSHMEKQLIALREKAEEASQAKSQFLARMSHEIRTPMNAVIGMSHLALGAAPDPRQRNYLTKIHTAARNLLGIINDILDFSKIEAGEMRLECIPFSLDTLVEDIRSIIRPLVAGKPLRVEFDVDPIATELMGDPLRMRQVLLNLINNAVKFTAEGSVTLRCRIFAESVDSCTLRFAVEDTGIGISEEARRNLFVSFQQLDGSITRKYGGTGLGLVICRQLINLMGSDIEVESTLGRGTTFFFTLSFIKASADDSLPDREPGHAAEEAALPVTAKVLVVEDNEVNQEIIVELLQGYGLKPDAVDNGQEAVDAVEKRAYDLVLMDLQMPVLDGLAATRAIRQLDKPYAADLPIIALTANAMVEDRKRCLTAGMNDFLSKPIEVAELNEKLHKWLGSG